MKNGHPCEDISTIMYDPRLYEIKLRQENSAGLHHYSCDQLKRPFRHDVRWIKIRGGRLAGDGGERKLLNPLWGFCFFE